MSTTSNEDDASTDDTAAIEIFKVLMGGGADRMDSASFGKLSPDAKKLWSKLAKEDRSVMLRSKPEERSVNVHEMSSGDEDDETAGSKEEDQELEVNKTETSTSSKTESAKSSAHPADIRRGMSTKAARKNRKAQIRTVEWGVNDTQLYNIDEEGDIAPNDEVYGDDSDDSFGPGANWPAFDGNVDSCWSDSSEEEDTLFH